MKKVISVYGNPYIFSIVTFDPTEVTNALIRTHWYHIYTFRHVDRTSFAYASSNYYWPK